MSAYTEYLPYRICIPVCTLLYTTNCKSRANFYSKVNCLYTVYIYIFYCHCHWAVCASRPSGARLPSPKSVAAATPATAAFLSALAPSRCFLILCACKAKKGELNYWLQAVSHSFLDTQHFSSVTLFVLNHFYQTLSRNHISPTNHFKPSQPSNPTAHRLNSMDHTPEPLFCLYRH